VSEQRTALVTGSSSGIGRATVDAFANAGWRVIATMRDPARAGDLAGRDGVAVLPLDVTDQASILAARDQALSMGRVDVVVNNAGYGLDGVFEAISDDDIRRQFETNVFGLMRVTRAFIPHFRDNGGGTFVQVASMGGRLTFPLYSPYHASKWAVEGFSESLHYELEQFGIRVKIVEPGAIKTEFYGRGRETPLLDDFPMYAEYAARAAAVSQKAGAKGESPEVVATAIVRAAAGGRRSLRVVVGKPAPSLLRARRLLPEALFLRLVKKAYR
jgi:NAD(P)-dependent dehydrogenase (short-subunit alcohol dehydrogenase family)